MDIKNCFTKSLVLKIILWSFLGFLCFILWSQWPYLPSWKATHLRSILHQPQFRTSDAKGRPYVIEGLAAFQKSLHCYGFHEIKAHIDTHTPHGSVWAQGKQGQYDTQNKHLELFGQVNLRSSHQHHMVTPYAFVDISKKIVKGHKDVTGKSALGQFSAKGFLLEKDKLSLTGPVTMTLRVKKSP